MKILSLALITICFATSVHADAIKEAELFATLSLADAETLINHAQYGSLSHSNFVHVAMNTRRMDLLKLCFENTSTQHFIIEQSALIKDPMFRDELVLMMLRSAPDLWPDDKPLRLTTNAEGDIMVEPFISTIKERLPNLNLADINLKNEASRLQLAADIEAAMVQPKADTPSENHTGESDKPATIINPPPSVTPRAIKRTLEVTPATAPNEKIVSSTPWGIIVGLSVAVLGVLCWLLKGRK